MNSVVQRAAAPSGTSAAQAALRLWRAAPLAVSASVAALVFVAVAIIVVFVPATTFDGQEAFATIALGLAAAACACVGALILAGAPRHRLGIALLMGGLGATIWAFVSAWAAVPAASPRPLHDWAAWMGNWVYIGLFVLVTWPLLLFPNGALPSRRWRVVGVPLGLAIASVALYGALNPGDLEGFRGVPNPLGIPDSWTWVSILDWATPVIPLSVVAGMFAVQRQARAHPGPGMRGALWASRGLAANFSLCLVLSLSGSALADGTVYLATFTTSIAIFAAAACVAIVGHRVVEIDVVLRRAFVVVLLAVVSLVVFVTVSLAATAVAGSTAGAIGGGLAVAIIAVPLRVRVQDRVDLALYGHRDASAAVTRVADELESAGNPADALAGIVRAIADTLGASGALLEPAPALGLQLARYGDETIEPSLERSLLHRGQPIGRLVLGARAPGEAYAGGDIALLEVLARQVVVALDALRLAAQVQLSREAIVSAREEERRRLRHELHDGLGAALAGIALTIEAAELAGGQDAERLVSGAREQTQDAVADVRRMVRGLRPPVLDDIGLTAALQAHASHLAPLEVQLDIGSLPPLSAAAELAIYRIACEALTNVVRHAHASTARLELRTTDHDLTLQVTDDGRGFAPDAEAGIGLQSIRERAAELGGRVELAGAAGGGAKIQARFALASVRG